MANPFDQFDESTSNPFDQFDSPEEKKKKDKKGFWQEQAANTLGTAAALGDVALGALKMPLQVGTTAIGKLVTPDVSTEAHRMASQETVEKAFPSIGHSTGADENLAYQNIMKPFELLGEGVDWIGNRFDDKNISGAVKNTIDAAMLGIGIPGARGLGRGAAKIAETIDPGIRNAGKAGTLRKEATLLENIKAKQAELDKQKNLTNKNPFDQFDEVKQQELLTPDNQGKAANPYEAQEGYWTVDENGIPIRADLSMEAQNLENPLQRNLFGDELQTRANPVGQSAQLPMDRDVMGFPKMTEDPRRIMENDLGMTQALDKMEDTPWRGPRDEAIDLLKGEIEVPGELKAAKMEADIPTTVRSPYTDPTVAGRDYNGIPLKQRGAINPEVFKEGFEKLKKLADGTWLRAHSDGQALTIDAIKDSHKIGSSTFDPKYFGNERNLEAFHTGLNADSRGKGYASEIYRFASELGNDIQRSSVQTKFGKEMWDGFERNGLAKDGMIKSPGNRQMGAVRLGEKKNQQLEKVFGKKNMIPDDPDVKAGIQEAYGDVDSKGGITGPSTLFESGSTLGWMKRRSMVVQLASRLLQNAEKRGSLNIIKNVFPTEKAFRALSKSEFSSVVRVLKDEMLKGERFSAEALDHLTVKQKQAYVKLRDLLDDTRNIQNEARAIKGQKPFTALEAYMSSRWDGAHRRPVFQAILDKNGNPKFDEKGELQKRIVWYLADDSKRGLEKQSKALLKDYPDLLVDPKYDHMLRNYKKQTDLQSAYTTMLDALGRDDPAVSRMKELLETQTVNEGASFLGQEKHFKEKTGVHGFVGDRPGKVGTFKEDLAFIQQQIQYAKNAYNWSEIQKASQGIKDILSDPKLKQEQPNNLKYIREYYKNAVGHGEAAAVAHMTDALRELGFNVDRAAKYLGGTKTYFILEKLGASTGNLVVNMLQSANILTHFLSNEWAGNRFNIPKAIAVGIPGGIAMATGHYLNLIRSAKDIPNDMKGFYERAFQYAEDNGITARSIYDESPIESSFSPIMKTANAFGRTISVPETFTRSIAYNMAVQFLKDSGKFTKDIDLFQRAEEMVNAAMVDYRTKERPMVFSKLGAMGNFLNTLQTYPMNWYNQWNYFAREGMKGNIAPFMGAFALQYALAGSMGMPYFNDMDKLYQFFKDHLPAKYYAQVRESEFWDDPKMWMMKNFGSASVYGWLSDKTGIGLTSRLSTPGMEDMLQSPIGPATDLAKQVYNAGKAVVNPNRDNVAQAAMSSAPVGLQGLVEYAPQFQGSTYEKGPNGETIAMRPGAIDQHTAVYKRTPEEDTIRKFGLRSTKESIEREINYRTNRNDLVAAEKERSLPAAIYAAAKQGDKEELRDLMTTYIKLHGSDMTEQQWNSLVERNYMTSSERAFTKNNLTPMQLRNLVRAKSLIEDVRKEMQQK
jgi:hypothetical protein